MVLAFCGPPVAVSLKGHSSVPVGWRICFACGLITCLDSLPVEGESTK